MYPPSSPPPGGYQPGYRPPPGHEPRGYPPMGYPPAPLPPSRSATPRVIGILAIVFACLGLLMSMSMSLGPLSDLDRWDISVSSLGIAGIWLYASMFASLAVFVLHLVGGISAVRYRSSAPRLMTIYGVAAIVLAVADVVVPLFGMTGHLGGRVFDSLVLPRLGYSIIALPWPIVALAMMNTRGAREACGADGRS